MAAIITMSMNVRLYVASSMNSISLIFDPMMGVYIALFLSKYCGFTTGLLIGTFTMRMLSTGLVSCGTIRYGAVDCDRILPADNFVFLF